MSSQANATMTKFGYPGSLVREYRHWVVLARPQQATLGALVLACKDTAEAFSEISTEAYSELQQAISDIERGMPAFRRFDKINYLMLMMVDKDVHFHVLPRYAEPQEYEGTLYHDAGWPAVPDLGAGPTLEQAPLAALAEALKKVWADNGI